MKDWIDVQLAGLLGQNARQSLAELARQLKMSGPSVSERLKRLEEQGAIRGYTPELDWQQWGYSLQAMVRLRPLPGQLKALEARIVATPQITECDKVTGEDCYIARLLLRDIGQLDAILDDFAELATSTTSIVKASPVLRRLPPLQP
ncbi:Lrp/AsnC family transcriptional regulator [Vogesella sp. LIG4]|uniref:Lrp/AsnC family transcriptional regulator n=1 Tax=Vogesella sp. LIG4 TaxID=1192162 RepID=UPI00081FC14D|nr:Lrp/AsnC family transcriptional regulator [Vogesella sp. LIG4]SCK18925.1 Lrp/AsnC family transcriptional regulator, leucine-responsive regulatory protein [Vogesella sp. LIG4]